MAFDGAALRWLPAMIGVAFLVAAVALSVSAFSLLHLLSDGGQAGLLERIVHLAMPAGFSFAAAMAYLASGSTWAAIGVHAGFHIANYAAALVGTVDSPWARGGESGCRGI